MRAPKGVLLPSVPAGRLRRGELYGALRNAVLEGVLLAGDRLPSTRRAATDYAVSRGLMEEVFGQLTDEGFFERAVGRGTFVASEVARLTVPTGRTKRQPQSLRTPSRRGSFIAANTACREPEVPLPFNAGIADTSAFPWKLWCRLQVRAARELGPKALSFADPRGLPKIRTAIARYLAQFRGIRCTPQQVIIFNSAQQALNALSVLLLNPGDAVWIEDPCYLGARVAFDLAGTVAVPVTVDENGLVVSTGIRRAPRARLAYVTPSHQYPTGVTLSLERRIELLQWAARKGSWIVEDDYDGEFRYEGQPVESLQGLDTEGRVVYIGTFSRTIFPALRIGYLIAPKSLIPALTNAKWLCDRHTATLEQETLAEFIAAGAYERHLRRARRGNTLRREALLDAIQTYLGDRVSVTGDRSGTHVVLWPRKPEAEEAIIDRAASRGVAIYGIAQYFLKASSCLGLMLGYSRMNPEEIREGIRRLADIF